MRLEHVLCRYENHKYKSTRVKLNYPIIGDSHNNHRSKSKVFLTIN